MAQTEWCGDIDPKNSINVMCLGDIDGPKYYKALWVGDINGTNRMDLLVW